MRHACRHPHNPQVQEKKVEPFFSRTMGNPIQKKENRGAFFQAKGLTVGSPGDPYEKEADAMANAVVNQPANTTDIHRKEISTIQRESLATPLEDEKLSTAEQRMEKDKMIQEKADPLQKEEKDKMVQTKGETNSNLAGPSLTYTIQDKAGKGKSLSQKTRVEMESAFGTDFSSVNIHTDKDAVSMNRNLHAQAFTHGKDIYFNAGKFNPETSAGKRLLAHELTHVVQQSPKADTITNGKVKK